MIHISHSYLKRGLSLILLAIFASTWLMMTVPALAQSSETPEPSMAQRFFEQPDVIAPLVVPMIAACGGVLTLIAFLGWVINRMPEDQ